MFLCNEPKNKTIMAKHAYNLPSAGHNNNHKPSGEIERANYPVLWQAQKAWEEIGHFRLKRKRNRDYTYG